MASYNVKVKYKYGTSKPTTSSQKTIRVPGQTESAIMAELKKKHPGKEILLLSYEWK